MVLNAFNFLQACKTALIKLGPLMGSEKVNEMFQKHLDPDAPLLYPDFLNDLCKHVVSCLSLKYLSDNIYEDVEYFS